MNEVTDASTKSADDPHARAVLTLASAMLRYSLWPVAATVALGVVVGSVLVGVSGTLGALTGGAVGIASCLATLGLMRWTAPFHPMFVMVAMLSGYVGKLLALMLVSILLQGVDAVHPYSLAGTLAATILVCAGAELHAFRKTHIPTIVPGG